MGRGRPANAVAAERAAEGRSHLARALEAISWPLRQRTEARRLEARIDSGAKGRGYGWRLVHLLEDDAQRALPLEG